MPTADELKDQQRRQWSSNAAGWDAQHDRLAREAGAASDWICREAQLAPGMRVLDLACGSGHPAIDAARLVSPGGSVVATDLVQEMVDFTMARVQELGITNVEGRVVDAETIDFPDASFDAVTCRFGIMFCPQPAKAAAEVHRVLKPGGRFSLCVWADPVHSPAQTVAGDAIRLFGRTPPPVNFEVPGIYQLAPEDKLERLLQEAGFAEVRTELMPLTWDYESLDAFWQRQMIRAGGLKDLAESLPPDEVSRLKACLGEVLQPYINTGGLIRVPITPLCAAATK